MIPNPELLTIFSKFEISPQLGFIPEYTPLLTLGNDFLPWENGVAQLPKLIAEQQMLAYISQLPDFNLQVLKSPAQQERALMILAHFAHAFIWETGEMRTVLPAKIAIPFVELADQMGRPAVVHHAVSVLNNWRKIDPNGDLVAENMQALIGFDGSKDESWFYNVTTEIEAVGAPALPAIATLRLADSGTDHQVLKTALSQMNHALLNMIHSLEKMTLHCHPERFYHKVRPFLASLNELTYEGVQEGPVRSYAGGSAAQSSLIQAFDIVLGIKHPHGSGAYLLRMRDHMPPKHKAFLAWLEESMQVHEWVTGQQDLENLFEELRDSLMKFRNTHLKIVARYIAKPARDAGLPTEGTGGTDALTFLKEVRNDMKD